MLKNVNEKWKITLIVILFLSAIAGQQYIMARNVKEIMLKERKEKIKEITQAAYDIVAHLSHMSKEGAFSKKSAQEQAKNIIRDIAYNDKGDYIFVYTYDEVGIAHRARPQFEGRNIKEIKDGGNYQSIVERLINAAKKGDGYVKYTWNRNGIDAPKISYAIGYEPWQWMIGTGVYIEDIERAYDNYVRNILKLSGFVAFILMIISALIIKDSDGS